MASAVHSTQVLHLTQPCKQRTSAEPHQIGQPTRLPDPVPVPYQIGTSHVPDPVPVPYQIGTTHVPDPVPAPYQISTPHVPDLWSDTPEPV